MSTIRNTGRLRRRLRSLEKVGGEKVLNNAAYAGGLVVQSACVQNIREAPSPTGKTGLIDTGFMVNSVFTTGPDKSGYGQAASNAQSKAARPMLGEPEAEQYQSIVSVGAEYFSIWEDRIPMLKPAATQNEGLVVDAVVSVLNAAIRRAVH
jgi:hypothetical protein